MQTSHEAHAGAIGRHAVLGRNLIEVTLHGMPPLLRYALEAAIAEFRGPQHVVLHVDEADGQSLRGSGAGLGDCTARVLMVLAGHSTEGALHALKRAMRRHPQAHPLVLALVRDDDEATRLIRSGARGYVAIDESPSEFVSAIVAVANGTLFVPRSLQASFAKRYLCPADHSPESQLTERELSVLRLLAEGLCNKEVAAKLFISVKTVDTHRMNLMRKLSLRTNVDIVRFALRRALIEL